MTINIEVADLLIKAFDYGIDYGQFLAETERDSEDLFDAVGCMAYSRKNCVPSVPAKRRQPHSDEWRRVKRDGMMKFIKLFKGGDEHD